MGLISTNQHCFNTLLISVSSVYLFGVRQCCHSPALSVILLHCLQPLFLHFFPTKMPFFFFLTELVTVIVWICLAQGLFGGTALLGLVGVGVAFLEEVCHYECGLKTLILDA